MPKFSLERTYEELKREKLDRLKEAEKQGLERTYEELKLGIKLHLQPVNWRLERTYEELKHPNTTRRSCFSVYCLERTYEELKLSPGSLLSFISNRFRAYLWGIETYIWAVALLHR